MITKKQYFKENILLSCFFNLPVIGLFSILANVFGFDTLKSFIIVFLFYTYSVINLIKEWYIDEKIESLEKEIKNLKS